MKMNHAPENREDHPGDPRRGEELLLEPRFYGRPRVAAAWHRQLHLGVAADAYGQDREEGDPPDRQIDRDAEFDTHWVLCRLCIMGGGLHELHKHAAHILGVDEDHRHAMRANPRFTGS